ncbi:MAG: DUF6701 domain-containing protein [Gammaproteobacteria bacterium]
MAAARSRVLAHPLARLLCLLGLLVAVPGRAHAGTYQVAAATFDYVSPAAHTRITSWPGCGDTAGDDSLSAELPLGFTFNYGGVNYTRVRVMTNGRLQFANTHCGFGTTAIGPPRTYTHLYPDGNVNRTIRIYGADLDVSARGGGNITFASLGTAPNRRFIVTWNDVSQWQAGGATNFGQGTAYNFQIQLHENGDFYFMYGTSDDVSEPANRAMGPAQVGWQLTTTDFEVVRTGLPPAGTGLRFSLPAAIAEYRFDQGALSGAPGEVLDSSPNALHGTRINAPADLTFAQTDPAGRVCQALSVPLNRGARIDAIDTGLPPQKAGSAGTITFWHRNNSAWGGEDHVLFDATMRSGEDFYLVRDDDGQLRFVVTDSGGRRTRLIQTGGAAVPAGTWKHVGVSWDLSGGRVRLEIYLDGVRVASTSDSSSGALASSLGSLHIGDNRSSAIELSDTRSADGLIDEFRVYNFAGGAALVTRDMAISRECSTIDHFAIAHGGTAVTCEATTVKLVAHLAGHTDATSYRGSVKLSTTSGRGDWSLVSGAGVFDNDTTDDGVAQYTFDAADGGAVAFALRHTVETALSIDVTDGTATEHTGTATADEDLPLTFVAAGFAFLADGRSGAIGTQIAGKPSGTAPGAQTLQLAAIRTDDATGACAAALAGTQVVDMAYECVDPAVCAGSVLDLSGTAIAGNPGGAVTGYTALKLEFDPATGRAPFAFSYADAGQLRLHARHELPDAAGDGSGSFMEGQSNVFTVRPFALAFTVTGNPAASAATGPRFLAAGTPFAGLVRAVQWRADDDRNGDGIADGHEAADTDPSNNASLADNPDTPSFNPGGAATLGARLFLPVGGNAPALAGTTSATLTGGRAALAGLRWDEVGIIELVAAQGGNYLGIGAAETGRIRGATGAVGRFHPARLDVSANVPAFADTCGVFTYADQPFFFATPPVLTVTALNARGTVTRNYTSDGFFKLASGLAGRAYADAAGVAAGFDSLPGGAVTLAGERGLTGSATLTLATAGGDRFTYVRAGVVAPFAARVDATFPAVDLTDADGICHDTDTNGDCDPFSINDMGGADLRVGRLATANAFGSDLLDLPVPARTEFFDGNGFVANADDACTTITTTALDLGIDGTGNAPAPGDPSVPLGAGATTAAITFAPTVAGDLGFGFSAPGDGNTGDVDYRIDLSSATGAAAEWLRFDWDGDGTFDDDPGGRVSFGLFRGRPAVVYQREPW